MIRQLMLGVGIVLALLVFLTPPAFAQTNDDTARLLQIKHSIQTLQELEQQGLLTPTEADTSIAYYLAQASKAAGHNMTLQQIMALPDPAMQTLTPLQVFAGAIDFLNVMMVLAILALGSALIYLFRYAVQKLLRLLAHVPIVVYELVFYLASVGCGVVSWLLPAPMHQYLAFLACLLFAGALGFSASHRRVLAHVFLFSLLLFLVWAPTALLFDSPFIGFLAVGALLSVLGFNRIVAEFFDLLHVRFRNETIVENATLGAFLVLTVFLGIHLFGSLIPALAVFEFGALFLGSLIGYGGLLILSDRWYWRRLDNEERRHRYWGFQVVAIVAGLGALFFGSLFQIGELQKVGGTFFVCYCLIKLAEIPTRSRPAFALLVVAIGILTIGFCWFSLVHPDLFRQWLFLPG